MNNPISFSYSGLDLLSFIQLTQKWKLNFIQLRQGVFSASIRQFITQDFQLGHAVFNCAVKQEGRSPAGVWTFAFVNDEKLYWRNYIVQPKSIIIYAPGSEINAVSEAHFEVMTFSLTENLLLSIAEDMNLTEFIKQLRSIELLVTDNPQWDILRNTISQGISSFAEKSTSNSTIEFCLTFTQSLIDLLHKSKISSKKVSSKKRLVLLQNAEKLMLDNLTENILVSDIAKQLGVSERTLLYAFKRRFQMGPKAFIKVLKLNHVKQVLKEVTDQNTIASVARENGFWHMGQFTRDYKLFFGELPSET